MDDPMQLDAMGGLESEGQGVFVESSNKLALSSEHMQRMAVCRVFKEHQKRVNGMDWSDDGVHLLTSSDDESIRLYECNDAAVCRKALYSKKYGVEHAKFARNGKPQALCASTSESEHALRLWDLWRNEFTQVFPLPAQSLQFSLHPQGTLALECSRDNVVRLFSLQQQKPIAKIQAYGPSCSAFDPDGLVFAVSLGQRRLHMFDATNYQSGQFGVFDLRQHIPTADAQITSVVFSPDGSSILVVTDLHQLLVLEAFEGHLMASLRFNIPPSELTAHRSPGVPCFSPDGQFIMCGGVDGSIHVWRAPVAGEELGPEADRWVCKLDGHAGLPRHIAFNPKKLLLASGCIVTSLWQPKGLPTEGGMQ
eukprot:GDKI01047423.1.p1 GENE.GDKI01047423.1~~GDKI01047423.1.p1  ORF type:complete len:365 (-),score=70.67 GDKI01047423.1:24-1118(-)